jgi:hypothetical protein
VGEDLGEGQAEDGDEVRAGGLQGILEMPLVKDVALTVLDQEQDAGWVAKGGFAVGVEGGCQTGGKALCAVVGGKVEGGWRDMVLQEGILGFGEISGDLLAALMAVRGRVSYL